MFKKSKYFTDYKMNKVHFKSVNTYFLPDSKPDQPYLEASIKSPQVVLDRLLMTPNMPQSFDLVKDCVAIKCCDQPIEPIEIVAITDEFESSLAEDEIWYNIYNDEKFRPSDADYVDSVFRKQKFIQPGPQGSCLLNGTNRIFCKLRVKCD